MYRLLTHRETKQNKTVLLIGIGTWEIEKLKKLRVKYLDAMIDFFIIPSAEEEYVERAIAHFNLDPSLIIGKEFASEFAKNVYFRTG